MDKNSKQKQFVIIPKCPVPDVEGYQGEHFGYVAELRGEQLAGPEAGQHLSVRQPLLQQEPVRFFSSIVRSTK